MTIKLTIGIQLKYSWSKWTIFNFSVYIDKSKFLANNAKYIFLKKPYIRGETIIRSWISTSTFLHYFKCMIVRELCNVHYSVWYSNSIRKFCTHVRWQDWQLLTGLVTYSFFFKTVWHLFVIYLPYLNGC